MHHACERRNMCIYFILWRRRTNNNEIDSQQCEERKKGKKREKLCVYTTQTMSEEIVRINNEEKNFKHVRNV